MRMPRQNRFSGAVLAALIIGYIAGFVLVGINADTYTNTISSNIGAMLILAVLICVLVLDWHGFTTLKDAIHWQRLSGRARFWLVCAYIFCFEIMLPIYFVRAVIDYRQAKQRERLELPHKVARLESELGIMPATEGTCRACQKPLQVGAEFCQYCGQPVIERPRVCPSCAATALPDAKWCPKCGKALDAISQPWMKRSQ